LISFFISFFSSFLPFISPACFMESIILAESIAGGGGGGGGGGGVVVVVVVVVDVESVVVVSDFLEHDETPPTNATKAPSTMSLRSLMAIFLLV
jgi:hypothetical protein